MPDNKHLTSTCEVCGSLFTNTKNRDPSYFATRRTCSETCGTKLWRREQAAAKTTGRYAQLHKACDLCGVEFANNQNYPPSDFATVRFCSRACLGKFRQLRLEGTFHRSYAPTLTHLSKVCKHCSTLFTNTDNLRKTKWDAQAFCSATCRTLWQKVESRRKNLGRDYTRTTPAGVVSARRDLYERMLRGEFRRYEPLHREWEAFKDSLEWKCLSCGEAFRNATAPRCFDCFPPSSTQGSLEKEVADFCRELCAQHGWTLVENTRKVIAPLELDLYIPEKAFAIEFDEILWHAEAFSGRKGAKARGRLYHVGKTNSCAKQGIQLVHLWETEWKERQDLVKSWIRAKLGVFDQKLNARECDVKPLTSAEAGAFVTANHLQGSVPASTRLGLYHRETGHLVSVLTLAKNRFKRGSLEMTRFCSLAGVSVRGGLSKLWKHFLALGLEYAEIRTYADRRHFDGASYASIGFEFLQTSAPGYWYTKDYRTLESRVRFQKHKLPGLFGALDMTKTEWELMRECGYDRVWDCGCNVFVLKR